MRAMGRPLAPSSLARPAAPGRPLRSGVSLASGGSTRSPRQQAAMRPAADTYRADRPVVSPPPRRGRHPHPRWCDRRRQRPRRHQAAPLQRVVRARASCRCARSSWPSPPARPVSPGWPDSRVSGCSATSSCWPSRPTCPAPVPAPHVVSPPLAARALPPTVPASTVPPRLRPPLPVAGPRPPRSMMRGTTMTRCSSPPGASTAVLAPRLPRLPRPDRRRVAARSTTSAGTRRCGAMPVPLPVAPKPPARVGGARTLAPPASSTATRCSCLVSSRSCAVSARTLGAASPSGHPPSDRHHRYTAGRLRGCSSVGRAQQSHC